MRVVKIVVLVCLVGIGLFIRLAPAAEENWHIMPDMAEPEDVMGGAFHVVEATPEEFDRLHAIILETRRTKVFAGSVENRMVTYVTRSLVFGFPDYTTVEHVEDRIEIFGRQRFGQSDYGVNATRIDQWVERFLQGG